MSHPITGKAMTAMTSEMLQEAIDEAIDSIKNRRWIVHVDYDYPQMRCHISKVEPWHIFSKYHSMRIIRIDDAPDELGAYAQALEILEKGK